MFYVMLLLYLYLCFISLFSLIFPSPVPKAPFWPPFPCPPNFTIFYDFSSILYFMLSLLCYYVYYFMFIML